MSPIPGITAAAKYQPGERVNGVVTRVLDFGAFVELESGLEGLIHVSEMSWAKKVRTPSDIVKPGDTVEAVILAVSPGERRIALGLKQALGDPWADASNKFPVGSAIEGPVTSITKFGAFVQLSEGIEGMIHVSDISAEKRINHPQDVLKVGQIVKAQVLEVDPEKRRLKLGIKQLVPTSIEEYIAEHQVGNVVSGRVADVKGNRVSVELGEGVQAQFTLAAPEQKQEQRASSADVSALSSMLASKWKGAPGSSAPAAGDSAPKRDVPKPGQVRSFKITKLDAEKKKIEIESA